MRRGARHLAIVIALLGCGVEHQAADGGSDASLRPDRQPDGWDVFDVVATPTPFLYGIGHSPQLVIDASGTFHITHVNQDTGDVLYSHGVPGRFVTEHVGREDATPTSTSPASQVVAPDGTVHVTYDHDVALGPVHATRTLDGTWSAEALPSSLGPAEAAEPALALFPDGHLLFVGVGAPSAFEQREVVAWDGVSTPTVVGLGDDGGSLDVSAVVTRDGVPHALFDRYLAGPTEIRVTLATRDAAGTWHAHDRFGAMAGAAAAAPDGTLHVVFTRPSGDRFELVHARGPSDDSHSDEEVVATQPYLIEQSSIVVGNDGTVHIAYEIPGEEHYVTNASGTWSEGAIEIVSTQNGRPSIALAPDGTPWIAYRDADATLVLATPHRGS